jgi:hypothetical protein
MLLWSSCGPLLAFKSCDGGQSVTISCSRYLHLVFSSSSSDRVLTENPKASGRRQKVTLRQDSCIHYERMPMYE